MNIFLDTVGMSSKWAGCLIVIVLFSIAGFLSVYSLGKVLNLFPVLVSEIEIACSIFCLTYANRFNFVTARSVVFKHNGLLEFWQYHLRLTHSHWYCLVIRSIDSSLELIVQFVDTLRPLHCYDSFLVVFFRMLQGMRVSPLMNFDRDNNNFRQLQFVVHLTVHFCYMGKRELSSYLTYFKYG